MSAVPPSISTRARGLVRASNSCGRLWFSTSPVRSGGGSFFNLGGLGASREAQYLSKERGIPRTEYNSNIHLIRSSEVDPFAPAPGSSRTAAAKAAARAQAEEEARSHNASAFAARHYRLGPGHTAQGIMGGEAGLEAELLAVREELAETKRYLRSVLQRNPRAGRPASTTSRLLSTAVVLTAMYVLVKDASERLTGPPMAAETPVDAQKILNDQADEPTAQRRRDAPLEEQVLAESGLTSFERQPEELDTPRSGRSVLSGLFWART